MNLFKIDHGVHMNKLCREVNINRKRSSVKKKSTEKYSGVLRKIGGINDIDAEGPSYEPGVF